MAWFKAEHRVLLAAVALAAEAGFDSDAWQLPATLKTSFYRQGYWDSLLAVQQTALAAALRLRDRNAQAIAHQNLAMVQNLFGHDQQAHSHFMDALDLWRQIGDRAGAGRTLNALVTLFAKQARYGEALDHCLQALGLFRAVGDRVWQANLLNNVGHLHSLLGNYQQALAFCQQAMTLQQELGDWQDQHFTWDSMGFAHQHLGHHAEALDCYERALAISREASNRPGQAVILTHLGDAYHSAGKPLRAREA